MSSFISAPRPAQQPTSRLDQVQVAFERLGNCAAAIFIACCLATPAVVAGWCLYRASQWLLGVAG